MKKPTENLRGEALYLANKKAIAARNDAARNRLEKARAPQKRKDAAQRRAAELQEMTNLPSQPKPPMD